MILIRQQYFASFPLYWHVYVVIEAKDIKTCFSRLHSLYICSATHSTNLIPPIENMIYIKYSYTYTYKIFIYKRAKIVLSLSLTDGRKTLGDDKKFYQHFQ